MPKDKGWFRVYDRMIDSPQILELNDSEFRFIVSLWCLASSEGNSGTVSFNMTTLRRRIMPDHTIDEIENMIEHLKQLDLLAGEDGEYLIPRWEKHQRPDYDALRNEWRNMCKSISKIIFKRDGYKCQYCGSNKQLTVDHIIPLSKGGTNEIDNLITSCRYCNSKKHDKTPEEMGWNYGK